MHISLKSEIIFRSRDPYLAMDKRIEIRETDKLDKDPHLALCKDRETDKQDDYLFFYI